MTSQRSTFSKALLLLVFSWGSSAWLAGTSFVNPMSRSSRRVLITKPKSNFLPATLTENDAALMPHHTALKTRNMTVAIQFYSLLGFELEAKFRAGPARAAWLSQNSNRIELIEVPSHMLQEPEGKTRRAVDLVKRPELLGWNHLALDVTSSVKARQAEQVEEKECGCPYLLIDWIQDLNTTSVERFGKTLRVAEQPRQQIIGDGVYELAFLYDADGAVVEVIRRQDDYNGTAETGWEAWSGEFNQ